MAQSTLAINGCTLVRTNVPRRCSNYFSCPDFETCLDAASLRNWQGWVEMSDIGCNRRAVDEGRTGPYEHTEDLLVCHICGRPKHRSDFWSSELIRKSPRCRDCLNGRRRNAN